MESFAEVFTLVKEYCKKEVSPVPYDLWIAPIQPVGFEDGKAKLSVNSSFMQDVVSKKYTDVLTRGFSEVMGFPAEVEDPLCGKAHRGQSHPGCGGAVRCL